jgi:transcriptional regulator with XRE-family HTH domain
MGHADNPAEAGPKDGRHRTPRDLVPGFAALVKARRDELGLTLYELARLTKLGTTSISCIENERRAPSLRVAMVLARALGLGVKLSDPTAHCTKQARRASARVRAYVRKKRRDASA